MCPDGDAAPHVGNDEVEIFVMHALNFGVTAGGGALIEGVPDADARHFGTAAEVSLGQHLVDDLGIGHQGGASRQLRSERRRNVATEVTHVLTNGRARVAQHGFVHRIDPGGNGMREATARDDGIEIEGDAFVGQGAEQGVATHGELRETVGKLCQFFGGVTNGFDEQRALVVINCHFGAGGAGIDDQNLAKRGGHRREDGGEGVSGGGVFSKRRPVRGGRRAPNCRFSRRRNRRAR